MNEDLNEVERRVWAGIYVFHVTQDGMSVQGACLQADKEVKRLRKQLDKNPYLGTMRDAAINGTK